VGAAVAALALGGCSFLGSDRAVSTSTAPSLAPTTTTEPAIAPTVTVTSAGAEPRQVLRYAMVAGRTSELEITTAMRIRQTDPTDASRVPVEVVVPSVVQRVEVAVTAVDAQGATITLAFTSAALAPGSGLSEAEVSATNAALAKLVGIRGTGRLAADGQLRTFAWTGIDQLSDTVRTTVESLAGQLPALVAPLPTAALGTGATWKATSKAGVDGTDTTLTTTYTLDGVLGTAMAYRSQAALTTGARSATAADGTRTELAAGLGSSTTAGTVDLSSLASNTLVSSAVEQDLTVTRDGTSTRLHQRIDTTLTITTPGWPATG
jgi:hypothetical protein